MATSAAPSPTATPVPSGLGRLGMPAASSPMPTGAFASFLDQLGQTVAPSTPAAATTEPDATPLPLTATPGQPSSPTATEPPLPASAGSLAALIPPNTAPTPGTPAGQPSTAKISTGAKTTEKKAAPDDEPTDVAVATPPLEINAIPAAPPVVAAATTTPAEPTSSTIDGTLPAAPTSAATANAAPTAAPTPPPAKSLPAPAVIEPTAARTANQAAAASQAGLSIDNQAEDDDETVEPPSELASKAAPQASSATAPQTAQLVPPLSVPVGQPPLTNPALPAGSPPAATTPTRGSSTGAARTSAPDFVAEPVTSSTNAVVTQPAATQGPDNQVPVAVVAPVTASIVPLSSTRPTQPAAPVPTPAAQVAQAIVEPVKVVLSSPVQSGPTVPHVTTIQITPAELGRVDIRIERTNDGPAKIQLVAERPETLSRLVHDQSQLQQALSHAGIPESNRTIEFSLAPATADTGFSPNSSSNNAAGDGAPGNGFQRPSNPYSNSTLSDGDDAKLAPATQSRILKTGIDITA